MAARPAGACAHEVRMWCATIIKILIYARYFNVSMHTGSRRYHNMSEVVRVVINIIEQNIALNTTEQKTAKHDITGRRLAFSTFLPVA